jgi:hypothetical protein
VSDLAAVDQLLEEALRAVRTLRLEAAPAVASIDHQVADAWLNEREAAELIEVHPELIRSHRKRGTGPPFRLHRRRVLYRRSNVLAWAARKLGRKSGCDDIDGHPRGP